MTTWSDGRQLYKVVRPIPGLPELLPGDHVIIHRGKRDAAMWRELDSRYEVVLGAIEGPSAALQGPIPFKDPGKDTPKPGRGTWEDEGEQWQGGSFNSDGTMRSEDWKGREAPPPPPAEPDSQRWVDPDTEKYAAGWEAFGQRGLLLPHAYHHAAKRWTHLPAPTPAPDFPSLDAWLDAERTGKLTHVPVYEPFSTIVLDSAWHLKIIPSHEVQALSNRLSEASIKRRDNPWPRVCCKCGAEFRPLARGRQRKAKRVRCEKCRKRGA